MSIREKINNKWKSLKTIWKILIIAAIVVVFVALTVFLLYKFGIIKRGKKTERFNYSLDNQNNAIEKFVMSYIAMENGNLQQQSFYNAGEMQNHKYVVGNFDPTTSAVSSELNEVKE